MKNRYNILLTTFLALWLVIGVTGCSDNTSSSEDEVDTCNSLALPSELAPATIAVEYFNNQDIPNDEEHFVYQQVKSIALSGSSLLSFGGNAALIANFLTVAPGLNIEPEADGGDCVWNINFADDFPQFGIDATISVIASQSGDRTNWQVIYDGELDEQVVEDFLFLDGFTANDQSTGEWNGYNPENPGSPAYTYTWDIEAENEYELNLDLFQEGQVAASVNYVKTGVENNLVYAQAGEPTVEVYWNEETDSGWLDEEGEERRCYTNFVNSACS
ncbi:MAG: hypothetical protein U5K72_11625 [Balneolaceae bacterium]|nr:hypothetical protein [Balneolaceae bacterium]